MHCPISGSYPIWPSSRSLRAQALGRIVVLPVAVGLGLWISTASLAADTPSPATTNTNQTDTNGAPAQPVETGQTQESSTANVEGNSKPQSPDAKKDAASPTETNPSTAKPGAALQPTNTESGILTANLLPISGLTAKSEPAPFNGSFTYKIDIQIPKFHEFEPRLSIIYDSNGGSLSDGLWSGFVGVGFRLSGLSDVVRGTRGGGTARFNADDTFFLDGQELVKCIPDTDSPSCTTAQNTLGVTSYAGRVEQYTRIEFNEAENTWSVLNKDGTKSVYISTYKLINPQSTSAGNDSRIRWIIDRTIDTYGNTIKFNYQCTENPICWPESIVYGGKIVEGNWRFGTSVQFRSEVTSPAAQLRRGTGLSIAKIDRRLTAIDVSVDGARSHAYGLRYEYSPASGYSRLIEVQQFGKTAQVDAAGRVSGPDSLPPVVLHYQGASTTLAADSAPQLMQVWHERGMSFITEADGDAKPDGYFAATSDRQWKGNSDNGSYGQRGCTFGVYGSTRSFSGGTICDPYNEPIADRNAPDAISFFGGDFNSDGWPDLGINVAGAIQPLSENEMPVCFTKIRTVLAAPSGSDVSSTSAKVESELTTSHSNIPGSSPVSSECGQWSAPDPTLQRIVGLTDIDGDGQKEFLAIRKVVSTNNQPELVALQGSGGQLIKPAPPATSYPFGADPLIADTNGDGLTDLVIPVSGATSYQIVQGQSNRTSISDFSTQTFNAIPIMDWIEKNQVYPRSIAAQVGDFNGDSQSDVVVLEKSDNSSKFNIAILISNGKEFNREVWYRDLDFNITQTYHSFGLSNRRLLHVGDINGDGRDDLVINGYADAVLLTSNGIGFVLSPEYLPTVGLVVDVDGDGREDIVEGYDALASDGSRNTYLHQTGAYRRAASPFPDLLVAVNDPLGGSISATYRPSSVTRNGIMPGTIQTIRNITVDDGRSNKATSTYAFSGGLFNFAERRFLGFRTAVVDLPCNAGESVCPQQTYTFRQDVASAGKLETVTTTLSGTLLSKRNETWTVRTTALPYKAQNTRTIESIYLGEAVTEKKQHVYMIFMET